MQRQMFSSKDQTWETPQWLFDELNKLFYFNLDVCADKDSAKCNKFYSEFEDGLSQDWNGICWMNPPYSRQQAKWIKKGVEEINKGNAEQVVVLIPARTDTVAWQKDIFPNANTICFVSGRLKFEGCDAGAPFPSAICVFGKDVSKEQIELLDTYGHVIRRQ